MDQPGILQSLAKKDFYLGPWLIQPGRNVITSETGETRLEPKIMQVLLCLAAASGETLSKETLNEWVWDGRVVSEKVLTRAISALRKALDDEARKPAYIETVSKTGYRLLISPQFPEKPKAGPIKQRTLIWALPTVFTTLIAIAWMTWPGGPEPVVHPTSSLPAGPAMPVTTYPGHELRPRLSPSGDRVIFSWQGEQQDNWDIYLRHVHNGEPYRLTQHPGDDLSPVWSPDGSRVAYFRFDEQSCGLYVQPVPGGTAQKVRDCFRPSTQQIAFMAPRLIWSRDGSSLIFTAAAKDGPQTLRIMAFSLETGEMSFLTDPPDSVVGDIDPALSPDGRFLAVSRVKTWPSRDLVVIDRETGAEQQLTTDGRMLLGHAWSMDGEQLIFSSNRDGAYRLWIVHRDGGPIQWFPASGGYLKYPHLSGQSIVYEQWQYDTNLWLYPVTEDEAPTQRIASTLWDYQPDYDDVHQRVAFVSNRSGPFEIWSTGLDGSQPLRLTEQGGNRVETPRWSPDGNALTFTVWQDGNADLYLWRRGMGPAQPLLKTPSHELMADWSIDGQSIFFSSDRDGDWQIWRKPLDDEEAQRVTTNGGSYALPSLDGAHLIFTRNQDRQVWRIPLSGGEAEVLFSLDAAGDWGNLAPVEGGLLFVRRETDFSAHLIFYDFETKEERRLRALDNNIAFHEPGLTAPADGSWVMLTRIDQTQDDIYLLNLGGNARLLPQGK